MDTRDIEKRYGQFGTAALNAVRQQVQLHGSLAPLLQRLGLLVPAGAEMQHRQLCNFIFQYGVTFFLAIVRSNTLVQNDIERMKARRLLRQTRNAVPSEKPASSQACATSAVEAAAKEKPTPLPIVPIRLGPAAAPGAASASANGEAAPLAADDSAASRPDQDESPILLTMNGSSFINTDNYSGPDRRNGMERRVGPVDRRKDTSVVFTNRRFGGRDRRRLTRRIEDRERYLDSLRETQPMPRYSDDKP